MRIPPLAIALVVVSSICLHARDARAQSQGGGRAPTRVPATIVLLDEPLSDDTPYRIVRRTDAAPRDLIVLGSDASPEALSEAVRNLLVIRAATGDTATVAGAVRVRPASDRRPARALPWAARVLDDVRRSEPRALQGAGMVRAVEIWLPPQRRKPLNR